MNPTNLERKHPSYDRSPWTCFNTSIKENIDLRNLIQKGDRPHKFKIYRSKDKSIPFFYDIQFI
ncbi:hypothetical protein [Leptospira borgpetersenii]|uniref:hypothetical protein n=1 Tax=Leptospira borgpetersenii TaxID=174 RepID=UPI0027DB3968